MKRLAYPRGMHSPHGAGNFQFDTEVPGEMPLHLSALQGGSVLLSVDVAAFHFEGLLAYQSHL